MTGGRRNAVSRDTVQRAMQRGGGAMYDLNSKDKDYKAKVIMWPNMWSPSDIGHPDCGQPTYTVKPETPLETIVSTAVSSPVLTHVSPPATPPKKPVTPPATPPKKPVTPPATPPKKPVTPPVTPPKEPEKIKARLKFLADKGRGQHSQLFDKLSEYIQIQRENVYQVSGAVLKAAGSAEAIQKPGTLTLLPQPLKKSISEIAKYVEEDRGQLYQYAVKKDNSYFRALLAAASASQGSGKNNYIGADQRNRDLILKDFMANLQAVMNVEINVGSHKTSFRKVIQEILKREPGNIAGVNPQALANGLLGAVLNLNIILLQWNGAEKAFTCDYTFIKSDSPYIVMTANVAEGYYQPVFKAVKGAVIPGKTTVIRAYRMRIAGMEAQGKHLLEVLNRWAGNVCPGPVNFLNNIDVPYQLGGRKRRSRRDVYKDDERSDTEDFISERDIMYATDEDEQSEADDEESEADEPEVTFEEVSMDAYDDEETDDDNNNMEGGFDPQVLASIEEVMGGAKKRRQR